MNKSCLNLYFLFFVFLPNVEGEGGLGWRIQISPSLLLLPDPRREPHRTLGILNPCGSLIPAWGGVTLGGEAETDLNIHPKPCSAG